MMDKEKIQVCINRASFWKKNSAAEISVTVIKNVERGLNVFFPNDFKVLCEFYGYDYFRLFDFLNFERVDGVIGETLYYRSNHGLAENYIVLFSGNVSFVVLHIESSNESEVIWCDYLDFFNLCDGLPMEYKPTIFPTFTDFYEFLLDEEEKLRAEE
jgi:hypothetical protein